jgi:hypothetical protein
LIVREGLQHPLEQDGVLLIERSVSIQVTGLDLVIRGGWRNLEDQSEQIIQILSVHDPVAVDITAIVISTDRHDG